MTDPVMAKLEEMGGLYAEHKEAADKHHAELAELGKTSAETTETLAKINSDMATTNECIAILKREQLESTSLEERLGKAEAAIRRNGGVVVKSLDKLSDSAAAYKSIFLSRLCKGGLSKDTPDAEIDAAFEKACNEDELFKNLAVNLDPLGGYQVPTDMSGQISTIMYETSPMRQVAAVQQISTDQLEGPIDEGRANFFWTGETDAPQQGTLPKRGMWKIPTHEAAVSVLITQKLLEDSVVNQEAWAVAKIADEMALGEATSFITGDGNDKPQGILTYADGSPINGAQPRGTLPRQNTGVNGGITSADPLVKMIYALKKTSRLGARFAFNREGIEKIRLLKQDDKYVWQPGLQAGEPDRLLGYAVEEFNDIPDFATDALVGIFADFAKTYQIVDRIQMSLLRDPYSMKPFVELYARKRVGGGVRNFDSCVLLKATS